MEFSFMLLSFKSDAKMPFHFVPLANEAKN